MGLARSDSSVGRREAYNSSEVGRAKVELLLALGIQHGVWLEMEGRGSRWRKGRRR